MPKSNNLIKAATDFSLTQFQHANQVYKHLHRGDLFSVRIQCQGGHGGRGFAKKNNIGGQGGDVKIEGTKRSSTFNTLDQCLEMCRDRKDAVKVGESRAQQAFNRTHHVDQAQEHFKKGFRIETDPITKEKWIQMNGFRGKDAKKFGTAFKGSDISLTVPLNTLLYEEIYEIENPFGNVENQRRILTDLRFVTEVFNPKQQVVLAHGGDPGCFQSGYVGTPGEIKSYQLVKSEKSDVLILGHSNSGKTTLFQQLTGRKMHSLISSGVHTTLGVQSAMINYEDGKQCKVLDTPDFTLMSALELSQRVTKSKSIVFLVDPFGYQPYLESEKKSAMDCILEMADAVSRATDQSFHNFTGTTEFDNKKIRPILVFNKLDLPGAKEKMEETLQELNFYKNDIGVTFEKILAISAETNLGLDKIKDYSRLVHDNYYEKFLMGREHRRLLALGKKWPPPSVKGPDAPPLADFPRETLINYRMESAEFKQRRIGGHMMLQPRERAPDYLKKSAIQDYANLQHIKIQMKIQEDNHDRQVKARERNKKFLENRDEKIALQKKEQAEARKLSKEEKEELRNLQANLDVAKLSWGQKQTQIPLPETEKIDS